MKFFLLIILLAIFVLVAIAFYLYFLYKKKLFEDLDYIAKYLKNNITFNKNNINILLTNAFKDINPTSKYILKNLSSPISKLFFRKDKNIVNDFYKSLGKGDVNFEVSNLNYYIEIFEELKKKHSEEMKSKAMVYFKLIIGFGLTLCIILI